MPKIKINHGKIELEVDALHKQLENDTIAAVARFSRSFIEATQQLINTNPGKLRYVRQDELDVLYPGQRGGTLGAVKVYPTRWVTNSVYVGLVYDELLLLELSPGPNGKSIRAVIKHKQAGHRRWSVTVFSFDKVLQKAAAYQQTVIKILAEIELRRNKVIPLP